MLTNQAKTRSVKGAERPLGTPRLQETFERATLSPILYRTKNPIGARSCLVRC